MFFILIRSLLFKFKNSKAPKMSLSRLGNCSQRKISNSDLQGPIKTDSIPFSNGNFLNSLKYSWCSSQHRLLRDPCLSPSFLLCPLLLLYQPGGLPLHIFLYLNFTQTLQCGSRHLSMKHPNILQAEDILDFSDPLPEPQLISSVLASQAFLCPLVPSS